MSEGAHKMQMELVLQNLINGNNSSSNSMSNNYTHTNTYTHNDTVDQESSVVMSNASAEAQSITHVNEVDNRTENLSDLVTPGSS